MLVQNPHQTKWAACQQPLNAIPGPMHMYIKKAIIEYKMQWARKEKADSTALDEWKCRVVEAIQTRIDRLRKNPRKRQVLSDSECQEYFADFQTRFVLVPADKASSNVLIVCKNTI